MADATDRLNAALTGRYRIERELGAGGMATVYLAEDLKHDRKVAIKVLKPELAAVLGAERFVVEIKTTAAMSHPHILPLFDSGTADGFLFYVMPYIQGETIREKLNRETQFGVDEAVRIAREVADALDYAHRHGVIHRDIKPENILLHDRRAMVMDFGIALAVSAAAGGRMTETGLSLGTPHYMSPEQATAEKEITARADQYSLASVLYEMLAGDPPFVASAAQAVIMKIITEPAAPVTTRRKNVPANIDASLAKALEKLPADRFESAAKFGDALGNPNYANASGARAGAGRPGATASLTSRTLPWGVAALALGVAVFFAMRGGAPAPQGETHLAIATHGVDPASGIQSLAISPDGRTVMYVGVSDGIRRLYRRPLDNSAAQVLTGTDGVEQVTFSPDGQWLLLFTTDRILKKVPAAGGTVVSLRQPIWPQGVAWSARLGPVVGMQRGTTYTGLTLIPASADTGMRVITAPKQSDMHHFPVLLDDGATTLFTHFGRTRNQLGVVSLDGGAAEILDFDLLRVVGVVNGVMVFIDDGGGLMAVEFDPRRRRPSGQPIRVGDLASGVADAALAANGTLALVLRQWAYQAVIVDDRGDGQPIVSDTLDELLPRYSPDGRRIAAIADFRHAPAVWVVDVATHALSKLPGTLVQSKSNWLDWSTDGRQILRPVGGSLGDGSSVAWQNPDAGDSAKTFLQLSRETAVVSLAPDQRSIALVHRFDIMVRPLVGDTTLIPIAATAANELFPRFSPDSRWIAYASDESGRSEVYVKPYPGPGARLQVSDAGGTQPIWARDGKRLFYRSGRAMIVADIAGSSALSVAKRQQLFVGDFRNGGIFQQAAYDVAPDGHHFVMARNIYSGGSELQVWTGWLPELKKRMAVGK